MSDENYVLRKTKKKSKIYPKVIVFVVGILFIITGIVAFQMTNKDKGYYKETTGVITSIEIYEVEKDDADFKHNVTVVHDVYVTYTVDGQTYTDVKLSSYEIGMKVGQTVPVTYDVREPGVSIANAKTSYGLAIAILVAGVLMILSIVVYAIIGYVRKQKMKNS